MTLGSYLPKPLKYPLIGLYVIGRLALRGRSSPGIKMNLAGVLPVPDSGKIIHGGKVKLLHIRERFGDSWKYFNLAYFASSGLPFAPSLWLTLYRLFGVKTVWNQNGFAYPALYPPEIVQRVNSLMKPMFLADHVIFQTEFTKQCAERFLGKLPRSHNVIINPVDTEKFTPRETPLPTEPLTVLMMGNHFESKERWEVSLEALSLVRAEIPLKLILLGKPDFETDEKWIEKRGSYLQKDAPALFREAHMFLHLKYLDPCPTTVLEAMASGMPVIGSRSGGMPELVSDTAGILLPVEEDFAKLRYPSARETANAILKIKDRLVEYGRGARESALSFDKKRWLAKHETIFNTLIS